MKNNIVLLIAFSIINMSNNINFAVAASNSSQYKKNCESLNGRRIIEIGDKGGVFVNPPGISPDSHTVNATNCQIRHGSCYCNAEGYECLPDKPDECGAGSTVVTEAQAAEFVHERQNNQGLKKNEKETNDQLNKNLKETKDVFSGKAHYDKKYKI